MQDNKLINAILAAQRAQLSHIGATIRASQNNDGGDTKQIRENIKKLSTQQIAQTKSLNKNLTDLSAVLKQNIKLSIAQGKGDRIAREAMRNIRGKEVEPFRKVLSDWGKDKKSGVTANISRMFSPSKWDVRGLTGVQKGSGSLLDRIISNREAKQSLAAEKEKHTKDALEFDRRYTGVSGKAKEKAVADIGARFDQMKAKEKELSDIQKKIDAAKEAGYAPKVKDITARDNAAAELEKIDPRRDEKNRDEAKRQLAQNKAQIAAEQHQERMSELADAARIKEQKATQAAAVEADRVAAEKEKKEQKAAFVRAAVSNTPEKLVGATKGEKTQDAEKRYDDIKKIEAKLDKINEKLDAKRGEGYSPTKAELNKKADIEADLTKLDPRDRALLPVRQPQRPEQKTKRGEGYSPTKAELNKKPKVEAQLPKSSSLGTGKSEPKPATITTTDKHPEKTAILSHKADIDNGLPKPISSDMLGTNAHHADNKEPKASNKNIGADSGLTGILTKSYDTQQNILAAIQAPTNQDTTKQSQPEQGQASSSSSGVLGAAADTATVAAGGGILAKSAGFLGRNAKVLGGIGAGAMGAYDIYSGWSDANSEVAAGHITADQGDIKKAGAVGKGTGGFAGAMSGGAMGAAYGTAVLPGVGTVIGGALGGALGYWGGSSVGEVAGTGAAMGYKALSGGSASMATKQTTPMGDVIYNNSQQAELAKEKPTKETGGNATVINAPTTVTNNSSTPIRSPIRNPESSVRRFVDSRY